MGRTTQMDIPRGEHLAWRSKQDLAPWQRMADEADRKSVTARYAKMAASAQPAETKDQKHKRTNAERALARREECIRLGILPAASGSLTATQQQSAATATQQQVALSRVDECRRLGIPSILELQNGEPAKAVGDVNAKRLDEMAVNVGSTAMARYAVGLRLPVDESAETKPAEPKRPLTGLQKFAASLRLPK